MCLLLVWVLWMVQVLRVLRVSAPFLLFSTMPPSLLHQALDCQSPGGAGPPRLVWQEEGQGGPSLQAYVWVKGQPQDVSEAQASSTQVLGQPQASGGRGGPGC